MAKFDTTGYLVVKISSRYNEKNIGRKCIPARWAEKALCDNYLIIRYPKEENSETRVQVINKEPSKKTWPFYCALIMFRTDSYEKAIEFIAENDDRTGQEDSPTITDEQPDNAMNETKSSATVTPSTSGKRTQSEENDKNSTNEDNLPKKKRESAIRSEAGASATPSTSGKRIQSEENDKNSTNEDNLPKKKRKSAIRSGNNLKMLILNKQLNYFPKQKVPTKKVLSLRKETRTETLETLISTGKFNKLEKLYTKAVASESLGSTVNDETVATDDSDSNNEPETIPPPDRNILKPVSKNEPSSTNTTKHPGKSKTPLCETVIATNDSDSNNEPETIHPPDRNILEHVSKNEPNLKNTTINPGRSKTPLPETVDSDPTQISSTNNLDQLRGTNSNDKGSQSSLNAEVSALRNLICNLAPGNGTERQNIVDIKHIEDIYKSILEVKSKMNAVYQEKSVKLKKAFESINLIVPEIKKGLSLPTIEQIKENSQPTSEEPKRLSSQEPSQRKGPSHLSHLRKPSLQQSELSSDSESFSQSPQPSISSKSKCTYVAKWTLKHQGPSLGLTELIPNTGIYVSEAELTRCKLLGTEMRQFARLLLPLIFTKEALSKCSYTGNGRNGKRSRCKDTRPGLDGHARNVLMDYVNKHAKESGWTIVGPVVMNQSLRDKLRVHYYSSDQ